MAVFAPIFGFFHRCRKVFERYMGKIQGQSTKNWLAFLRDINEIE